MISEIDSTVHLCDRDSPLALKVYQVKNGGRMNTEPDGSPELLSYAPKNI